MFRKVSPAGHNNLKTDQTDYRVELEIDPTQVDPVKRY